MPNPPVTVPPDLYTVNRSQDGAEVRAELPLGRAKEECAILNGQSRMQVGMTSPVFNERGGMREGPRPIFGSMFDGGISQYEVRSASGLVV